MKSFAEMTHQEQVAWATGHLTLAIGEGRFRAAVAEIVTAVSEAAFARGKAQAAGGTDTADKR